MAQRKRTKHRSGMGRKKHISLRLRALFVLLLCSALGLIGIALLTYPQAEIGLLAYASAAFSALHGEETASSIPVMQQNSIAASTAAEIVIKNKTSADGEKPSEPQPTVLIYHTHATEAYLPTEANPYAASGSWRTEETDKSVIAVGARLAEELQNTYGIEVIHDTTNHEPPKLSTAYNRSELTMEAYRKKYPSISLYIDVHRDAYGNDVTVPTDYLTIDGAEVARVMFVVGTGQGATGTGFDEMPQYESNLALAEQITTALNTVNSRLAREVRVKTGRYNQHVSDQCLLVEVGHNANTLEQALAAVPYLAKAIADTMESMTLSEDDRPSTAVWLPMTPQQ